MANPSTPTSRPLSLTDTLNGFRFVPSSHAQLQSAWGELRARCDKPSESVTVDDTLIQTMPFGPSMPGDITTLGGDSLPVAAQLSLELRVVPTSHAEYTLQNLRVPLGATNKPAETRVTCTTRLQSHCLPRCPPPPSLTATLQPTPDHSYQSRVLVNIWGGDDAACKLNSRHPRRRAWAGGHFVQKIAVLTVTCH
ncbi:hypothetical protein BCR39DRAFT_514035 [Naematelia encephala]|uniref:Uncharacterized protein n=1 Tax=Naematelia encephala TaxID=71784 RepID=A0A1Y2BIT2_9TREE|nr:hypothetical protein BCR39DRAFT_514035 [Naematelia encephala]